MVTPVAEERTGLRSDTRDAFAQIHGVSVEGPEIYRVRSQDGENFSAADVQGARPVALLSAPGRGAALSRAVRRGAHRRDPGPGIEVAGVYQTSDRRIAEGVMTPFTVLRNLVGRDHLQAVAIATERAGDASRVAREVTNLLRERHELTRAAPPALSSAPHAFRRGTRLPDDFVVCPQVGKCPGSSLRGGARGGRAGSPVTCPRQ